MPDRSAGEPQRDPIDRDTFLDESLTAALEVFRTAYLGIARRAPDEVAQLIRELPDEEARRVIAGLSQAAETGKALAPLIRRADLEQGEEEREPTDQEPQRILAGRVVVLAKESKLEYDLRTGEFGSAAALRRHYIREGIDPDFIEQSHQEQAFAVSELSNLLGHERVHSFWKMEPKERQELLGGEKPDLIVSLGGDDTAKAISHHIKDTFFVMLNSDTRYSVGAMTLCGPDHFAELFGNLERGSFRVQEWTRLEGLLLLGQTGAEERVPIPLAINEIGVHDRIGDFTFRGGLINGLVQAPVKGTGALIATGAGSGGWYNSATEALFPLGRTFPKTKNRAEFVVRERYRFQSSGEIVPPEPGVSPGVLSPGETLVVTSSSNHEPIVSVDSVWRHAFPRGSRLEVRISSQPLKVLRDLRQEG